MSNSTRPFSRFSQAEMYMLSKQTFEFLKEDLSDFRGFDAVRFTAEYLVDFEAAVLEVRDQTDDETVLDKLTGKTATVEEVLTDCRKAYKHLKYFVVKAFETQQAVQNEFGLDDYDDARRSQAQMIVFMGKTYRTAVEYQTQLLAAGYSQSQIQELAKLRDALESANFDQDSFKNKRQQITQTRRAKLETAMKFVSQTCEVGKIIYEEENPAKYNRYVMEASSGGSDSGQPRTKTLAANEVVELSDDMDAQKTVAFSTPTGSNVRYGFAAERVSSVEGLESSALAAGKTEVRGQADRPLLYVHNAGMSTVEVGYQIKT